MKLNFINNGLKRILIFIISIVSICALSACTNTSNRNPYGNLDLDAIYASNGQQSVTVKELYDELRYQSTDYFNNQVVRAVLDKYIKLVYVDKENTSLAIKPYADQLEILAIKEIYGVTVTHTHSMIFTDHDHEEEINKQIETISAYNREIKIAQFIDKMWQQGYSISKQDVIDRDFTSVFDFFVIDLAKYYLATEELEKTITEKDEKAEEEDEYYFTNDDVINYFDNNYKNTRDTTAVIVRFFNAEEANTLLKQFGIKAYRNEWYQIQEPTNDLGELDMDKWDTQTKYDKYYDDYTVDPNKGDASVRNRGDGLTTLLKVFIEIYNYMYPYRGDSGQPPLTYPGYRPVSPSAGTKDYLQYYYRIKQLLLDDGYNSQDDSYQNTVDAVDSNEFLNFTKDKLDKFSTSLTSYVYSTLRTEPEQEGDDFTQYSSSARSYGNYYYLIFKIDQEADLEFYSKDEYEEKTILDTPFATELKAEILAQLRAEALTESYIGARYDERFKKASIKIYDSILELNYANSNAAYKSTKSTNKNLLGLVSIDGEKHEISVDDAYAFLDKTTGPRTAMNILFNKYVKTTTYYQEIYDNDMAKYRETVDAIMVSFAAGNFAYYGYPASMGKYNFMKMYFKTTSITSAITDFLMLEDAKTNLIKDLVNTTLVTSSFNIFDELQKYASLAYNNHFSLEATHLLVYIDMDEDGIPDEDFISDASDELRQKSTELVNTILDKVANSVDDLATAISNVVSEYNKSSRIVPSYCDSTNAAAVECTWSEYKKEGLFVSTSSLSSVTNASNLDDTVIQDRIKDLYFNTDIIMNAAFTTSYLDQDQLLQTDDGYNILLITNGTIASSSKYDDEDNKDLYLEIPVKINDKVVYLSAESTDDIISIEQMEIYFREYIESGASISLPTDITTALDTYAKPLIDRFSSDAHQMVLRMNILGTVTFQSTEAQANLDMILAIAQRTVDEYKDTTHPTSNYYDWWQTMFLY